MYIHQLTWLPLFCGENTYDLLSANYNYILLVIVVTMVYIRFLDLINLITKSSYPLTNISLFLPHRLP